MIEEKIYSAPEVRDYLGVSNQQLYKLILSGKLKAFSVGIGSRKHWKIKETDLKEFMHENENVAEVKAE